MNGWAPPALNVLENRLFSSSPELIFAFLWRSLVPGVM